MTAMYANYIKTPLYVHAAETIHSTFIELGSTQPTQLYFERSTHEYIVVLANGWHFKGHTHCCCLGLVSRVFVNNELATQTVPATIDTAGMLAYKANQTAEAKYTSLHMPYKWPAKFAFLTVSHSY